MTVSAARLTEVLAPVLAATGADLEDVAVAQAGRRSVVRVLVDRDGGIDLDGVAEASRLVSDTLDELDEREPGLLGPSYVLEVSSPGVDRPLTAPRHWRRNIGRLVTVTLVAGGTVTGRVTCADEAAEGAVTMDVDGSAQVLAYAAVVRGNVQVEFARKDAEPDPGDDA